MLNSSILSQVYIYFIPEHDRTKTVGPHLAVDGAFWKVLTPIYYPLFNQIECARYPFYKAFYGSI